MQRNDLIVLLSGFDNDNVAAPINGVTVDIDTVDRHGDMIALLLDPDGLPACPASTPELGTGRADILKGRGMNAEIPGFGGSLTLVSSRILTGQAASACGGCLRCGQPMPCPTKRAA